MKKNISKFMYFSFILAFFIGFSELGLFYYYNKAPIKKLILESSNLYLRDWQVRYNCPFASTIITHPTLGFIHKQQSFLSNNCNKSLVINNIGIETKNDLPFKKNKNEYRILITGGSVAHQFANYTAAKKTVNDSIPYFEKYLNNHYISPNGFPFKVSNGSVGAWIYPNQINMLVMYSKRIDAIISIDGYNEALAVFNGNRFENHWGAQLLIASLPSNSFIFSYLKFLATFRLCLDLPIIKNSYTFFSVYKIGNLIFSNYFITDKMIREFSEANSENINLGINEKREFVLELYDDYIRKFHGLAKVSNLKSAEFLQPNKLKGKVLTDDEKKLDELLNLNVVNSIQNMFGKLSNEKYPVVDLSYILKDRKETIYGDHIHFINENGFSLGNEIMAVSIANSLELLWKLKRKP